MNNLEYLYNNNPKQLGYLMDDDCDNCEFNDKCHLTEYAPCSSDWLFAEHNPNDFVDSWEKIEATAKTKLKCDFCNVVSRCKALMESQAATTAASTQSSYIFWDAFKSRKIAVLCNTEQDALDFLNQVEKQGVKFDVDHNIDVDYFRKLRKEDRSKKVYYFISEDESYFDGCYSDKHWDIIDRNIITWKEGM